MNTYDIVWDKPGKDYNDSMPLGNGDIGLNAWTTDDGDLIVYIAKTDSWDDYGRLLKVGRVRFHLEPNPWLDKETFYQRLALEDGIMYVQAGSDGNEVAIQLWVDAYHPIIHLEVDAVASLEVTATIELWRDAPNQLASIETSDVLCKHPNDQVTIVQPDTVLTGISPRIGWYHHNRMSVGPSMLATIQGVDDFPREDPLLDRIFGAVIRADNGQRLDDRSLLSPKAMTHRFDLAVSTNHPATKEQWLTTITKLIDDSETTSIADLRLAHTLWWNDFWQRSYIHITNTDNEDAFVVSRAYALQRYLNACAGRGQYPIKFNGSIFTVPANGQPGDADYRRWGPGYWWQNTRLPYLSMCASADFDLIQPLFTLYAKDLMPLFTHRTKCHTGHAGAYIPECIYFWGDLLSETYGWTPCHLRSDKLQENPYHKWEWVSGLELAFMMLEYYAYTQDQVFLMETVLPATQQILTFFDEHYGLDEQGKLWMHPSQALETWWECVNPMPEVAGLHAVTDRLLKLDPVLTTKEQRDFWTALKAKIPNLPLQMVNGVQMLAPAEEFAQKRNCENPELYAVFPFRCFAVGKPNIHLAIEALNHRLDRGHFGWRQDDIFMAYLGLADQARQAVVERARNRHQESRFPAFWGPNYDWVPDQDHGGVLLKALQTMVMQTEAEKIYLLPAWPKDWDVEFKLHAPHNTIVEAKVCGGKIVELKTTPPERLQDVVVCQ